MRIIILFLLSTILVGNSYAQQDKWIKSIATYPPYPTDLDSVEINIFMRDTCFGFSFTHSVSENTISVAATFNPIPDNYTCTASITHSQLTLPIGTLESGIYNIEIYIGDELDFSGSAFGVTKSSNYPTLTISPPTCDYLSTQNFDFVLAFEELDDWQLLYGNLILNGENIEIWYGNYISIGENIENELQNCLISGSTLTNGLTLRCPGISADNLQPGSNFLTVNFTLLNFVLEDVAEIGKSIVWNIIKNTEE